MPKDDDRKLPAPRATLPARTGWRDHIAGVFSVVAFGSWLWSGAEGLALPAFSLAALALANLDRITELTVSWKDGVRIVREAQDALTELRHLAQTVAELTLWSQEALGRFGGGGRAEKHRLRTEMLRVLGEIGLSQKEVSDAFEPAARFVEWDYYRAIFHRHDITKKTPGFDEFVRLGSRELGQQTEPEVVRAELERLGLLDDEFQQAIDDYAHWRRHRSHRRLERWLGEEPR